MTTLTTRWHLEAVFSFTFHPSSDKLGVLVLLNKLSPDIVFISEEADSECCDVSYPTMLQPGKSGPTNTGEDSKNTTRVLTQQLSLDGSHQWHDLGHVL